MPDDFERRKALITLMDSGYTDQLTIGHDFSGAITSRATETTAHALLGTCCSMLRSTAMPTL